MVFTGESCLYEFYQVFISAVNGGIDACFIFRINNHSKFLTLRKTFIYGLTMREAVVWLFLLFNIVAFHACKSKPGAVMPQASWTSAEPLLIPLSVREHELSKKNLILNPSFEDGRFHIVDSTETFFILKSWEKIGNNVFWTDIQKDNEFGPSEAFHGLHAVKIVRERSDETDNQGEGVLSDYIKVIPGKYLLSYHIKLKQVEAQKPRIFKNLGDAINVRMLFFDENKILISSSAYNHADKNLIDNSFKGLSFSDFRYIDNLGWGKAFGKTAHFPFNDGDMPDKTHYVRIFFGLKGNGTLWIDMVNLEYSSGNFSFHERTQALFNSQVSQSSYLIPTPKNISGYSNEPLRITVNNRSVDPVILVPVSAGKDILMSAQRISIQLGTALRDKNKRPPAIRIINKPDPGMIETGRLIISLGKTQVYNKNADRLPVKEILGKQQAYFISIIPPVKRLIFVDASDDEGFHHACNTIIQLINIEDQVYHHYNIVDYPDVLTRAVILPVQAGERYNTLIARVNELTEVGYNLLYLQPGDGTDYPAENIKKIKEFAVAASRIRSAFPGIELGISLNHIRYPKPVQNKDAYVSFKEHTGYFNKLLNEYIKAGFVKILISDEFIWDLLNMGSKSLSFNLIAPETFEEFFNLSNLFFLDFKLQLEKSKIKEHIIFLPVLSTNEDLNYSKGYASIYFRELRKFENIFDGVLWKGPTELPGKVDFAEVNYYQSESRLRNYFFINNLATSPGNRFTGRYAFVSPGEARTGNLFEALNVDIGGTPGDLNLPSYYLVSQSPNSVISGIRVLTAADYMWNIRDYEASGSSWRALHKLYGREKAMELVKFNENLCRLLQLCMILEQEESARKDYTNAEEIIIDLNARWNRITKIFSSESELLNELSDAKNQLITRLYQIL